MTAFLHYPFPCDTHCDRLVAHRRGIFTSDDRKALLLASELAPPLSVCRTAFLVRRGAEETGTASHRIREVLQRHCLGR